MIGSPGTGEQHFESRTSTSSTPAMRMPDALRAHARASCAGRGSVVDVDDVVGLELFLAGAWRPTAATASPKPIAA